MDKLNDSMKKIFENPYVSGTTMLVIILYASLAAPKLPPIVAKLFDQNLFRMLILFLIAYISVWDVSVALILAVAFIVSIQTLNRVTFEEQLREWLMISNENEYLKSKQMGSAPQQASLMAPMPPMAQMSQMPTEMSVAQEPIPANMPLSMTMPQQQFGPDVGFETGTVGSGCYGSTTGLQGYDSADQLSSY